MKKLKLRSKELVKMGYPEGETVSLVINTVQKYFKRTEKSELLERLSDLLKNPKKYAHEPGLDKIVEKLLSRGKKEKVNEIKKPVRKEDTNTFLEASPKEYVIYGREHIESEAIDQMETAMRLPVTIKGALMPDAHSGYGLPIGGVLATRNAVIPFGVGMDIGCRMCLSMFPVKPDLIETNRQMLKEILMDHTRFGQKEIFKEKKDHEVLERKEFHEIKILKSLKDKAYEQIGTSGSGNHFVEFGVVALPQLNDFNLPAGNYLGLLSHSGSRNFGANIALHYTDLAKKTCRLGKGAVNLAWLDLDKEEGEEYWLAMNLAGDYARANHEIIHKKIAKALGEKPLVIVENHHNFAWKEKSGEIEVIVHRKGATPAGKGNIGIIPGSMTLPGFIVKGKGNELSVNSASHGAGRLVSRSKAKEMFSPKSLRDVLHKAQIDLIGGGPDEAPMAYKDIYTVMEHQKDLVEIVGTFQPRIVRMSGD